jgi:UDP-2,3-diacylglucosamine pyrophosphatase LpxH
MRCSRRVVVISDLHLTPDAGMMSHPDEAAKLIASIQRMRGEDLELVIAGDFIDYLAIPPLLEWTPHPQTAAAKLTFLQEPPHLTLTQALREFLAAGNALTFLIGNHDVELSLPSVQSHLQWLLEAAPHSVRFVSDGRAYTVGRLLIEHGNRYDGANLNDWNGLRAISSAQSRGEPIDHIDYTISAGSQLVHRVLNPLKSSGYPFLDLLKPQNELIALLLLAFEPEFRWNWSLLARAFRTNRLQTANLDGSMPSQVRAVSSRPIGEIGAGTHAALEAEFGDAYRELFATDTRPVGAVEWAALVLTPQRNGVRAILERGEHVPPAQLRRIRTIMRPLLEPHSADTAQYGRAASRLNAAGFQTVVMGHTHLAREVQWAPDRPASYINCGTWIDSIEIPSAVLEEPITRSLSSTDTGAADEGGAFDDPLESALRDLLRGTLPRTFSPNWAEIVVAASGEVEEAYLRGTGQ